MTYLLIILLLFGLVQSLLELKKENSKKNKRYIQKTLSVVYILGFVIGFIIVLLQENEANNAKEMLTSISSSVIKTNFVAAKQLEIVNTSIKQTHLILDKADSMNKKMIQVLRSNESLIQQYNNVNEKLSKQLELDDKLLMERAPSIGLLDADIRLEGNDSTNYQIVACIRNFGKRNAIINGGSGYVLFFNKKNQPIFYAEIRGNNNKGILEPNEIEKLRLCYYSFVLNKYNLIKTESDFAVICLKINYKDIAMNKETIEFLYSGWHPFETFFGGLKDWQYNLAIKWVSENIEFY